MNPNSELVSFIKKARARGLDDYEIRKPLVDKGWAEQDVERAFSSLKKPIHYKNRVCVYLDSEILRVIEKRAKRNMLAINEQIEDIVRRSAVNQKKTKLQAEKLDDMLV